MTKEEILTVINYMLTTNAKDWRTIICIFGAVLIVAFIITKLVIKIFFKEMDFKIPMHICICMAGLMCIYIVVVLATFVYNSTCYDLEFKVIPLIKSEKYIDAFDIMGDYGFKDYIDLREKYYEEYTYQVARKLEKECCYIDAFIKYYEILDFEDSREKAIELIPYVKEELSK